MEIPENFAQALIGPKHEYYLDRWKIVGAEESQLLGMNWASFFLGPLWMLYRKMYRHASGYFAIIIALEIVEQVIVLLTNSNEFPPAIDSAIGFAMAVVCGRYATYWYYQVTLRRYHYLTANRALTIPTAQNVGGVNRLSVAIAIVVLIALALAG